MHITFLVLWALSLALMVADLGGAQLFASAKKPDAWIAGLLELAWVVLSIAAIVGHGLSLGDRRAGGTVVAVVCGLPLFLLGTSVVVVLASVAKRPTTGGLAVVLVIALLAADFVLGVTTARRPI